MESSLIRLWHTRRHIRITSIPVVIQDCKIGASVKASAAAPLSQNQNFQIGLSNLTYADDKLLWFETFKNLKKKPQISDLDLGLLKAACSSAFISNSNKTLKPMQDFNGWNVQSDGRYSHRWRKRGRVNKDGEMRWDFSFVSFFFLEITLVRPVTGHTHTFNANSSTTGKTLKFENVCVMIRIQLHTKTPTSPATY